MNPKLTVTATIQGRKGVNADHLMPHELLHDIEEGDSMAVLQFMSIIRKTKTPDCFFLIPVVDVSGSMAGIPMEAGIAMALIVAYSQPEGSAFSRMFLTFDSQPSMYRLPPIFGEDAADLASVIKSLREKPAGLSTNFNLCMDMMLREMCRRRKEGKECEGTPVLIVFTDMEFDSADGAGMYETNLKVMERKYQAAGIRMPLVVFWNLRGVPGSNAAAAPASKKNVVMLSGFSTDLMEDFFAMLGSGKFRDVHIPNEMPCADEGEKEDNHGGPELSTDEVLRTVLQTDMYRRYRDV